MSTEQEQNRIAAALERLADQNDEHEEAKRLERFNKQRRKDYENTIGFPDRSRTPWWAR